MTTVSRVPLKRWVVDNELELRPSHSSIFTVSVSVSVLVFVVVLV